MKHAALASACCAIALLPLACAQPTSYPDTRRVDVVDEYHGTRVPDPYRWLEDLDSAEVQSWVAAQNDVSRPFLESSPVRDDLKKRLTELWSYERYAAPFRVGGRYFFFRNDGEQDQDVLYVLESLDDSARVLLDPNGLSADATVSLGGIAVSPGGRYLAYGLSDGGTDWRSWHVRDIDTGEDRTDVLRGSKFGVPVAWTSDEEGFFITRYPKLDDGSFDDSRQASVYYHRLGDAPESARLVLEVTEMRFPYPEVTDDGRFLTVYLGAGASANELYVKRLDHGDEPIIKLFEAADAQYIPVDNDGDTFFIFTTNGAPLGRLVAVDLDRPEPANWREVIPASEATLVSVSGVGGQLIAQYLEDASARVRVFDRAGRHVRDIKLPGMGSTSGFEGDGKNDETFFSFTSYTTPGTIYRYDVKTGTTDLWKTAEARGFRPDDYVVEQVFFFSDDGTRVPMFVVHKKGIARNGSSPTVLFGYGGFNWPLTPGYNPALMAWLERGGVYAVANLRGGGEYGEAWHQAGTKLNKQNVFDDFKAAAQYLISKGYTSSQHLGIQGESNGGLLVGAAITQWPELFGAALLEVGLLDMLRYHTPGSNPRQWSAEYGLSESPDEFEALYAYSPYHSVIDGTCYPPILITTADHDDRVVPWHSYKFAAAMQHAHGCENPLLLRVETRAGHGAGTPIWMRIEQVADQWGFFDRYLR